MGEGEGLKGKIAPFFLLPTQSRGGGALGAAGGPGHGGGRGQGGKREGAMGSRFPSPISEERPRREGRNGHGRGGRAAAMGSVGRGG